MGKEEKSGKLPVSGSTSFRQKTKFLTNAALQEFGPSEAPLHLATRLKHIAAKTR